MQRATVSARDTVSHSPRIRTLAVPFDTLVSGQATYRPPLSELQLAACSLITASIGPLPSFAAHLTAP